MHDIDYLCLGETRVAIRKELCLRYLAAKKPSQREVTGLYSFGTKQ